MPHRVKPSFVIFDIRALWRSGLSTRDARVPGERRAEALDPLASEAPIMYSTAIMCMQWVKSDCGYRGYQPYKGPSKTRIYDFGHLLADSIARKTCLSRLAAAMQAGDMSGGDWALGGINRSWCNGMFIWPVSEGWLDWRRGWPVRRRYIKAVWDVIIVAFDTVVDRSGTLQKT